ncbi:MAG: malto-oligosyltrehalose trehalohydrolase [Lentimicrobium sp.]|jgi:maltooligosyltrehalose trehalohydrolase|nr:malto-oligosyltrehalose trehalohydrolase [Lentimicrobium sp.]
MTGTRLPIEIGARMIGSDKASFKVWAPYAPKLSVKIFSRKTTQSITLKKERNGYFSGSAENVRNGDRYYCKFGDGRELPDPVSRFQPEGVHGPSQIIDPLTFLWDDKNWKGVPLKDLIIYELHVGTFTRDGTFTSITPYLEYLRALGVTAIELMPVGQFPGSRNWGYDGVYPFAPQNTYGGPSGLKTLVNACHKTNISVILDVVYNHLGPEGNYLSQFGPYFTDRYKTPWGDAINYDGPYSDDVRHYFICNALFWVTEYHLDALRIDAIHGIYDFSARHILEEIGEAIHYEANAEGRNIYIIPESDLNDVRIINPKSAGGFGLDAQWNDDFHHALHALITGERDGYYHDFGSLRHLSKALRKGFVYDGQYSRFRRRRHGNSSEGRPCQQFVVFSQNHDQVGNRMLGDRLSANVTGEQLKLAASVVLLSPFIPLLFMGEEYGETAPFLYFVHHSDNELIEAVRRGRRDEFAVFGWQEEPPDPQAEESFRVSKLSPENKSDIQTNILFNFYQSLIALRKELRALGLLFDKTPEVTRFEAEKVLLVEDYFGNNAIFCLFSFNEKHADVELTLSTGHWEKVFDASSQRWGVNGHETAPSKTVSKGSGTRIAMQPWGAVVYRCGNLES